jgi:hypothetical protein
MDLGGTSDPYVKIYLLPDKKRKQETKVTATIVYSKHSKFLNLYSDVKDIYVFLCKGSDPCLGNSHHTIPLFLLFSGSQKNSEPCLQRDIQVFGELGKVFFLFKPKRTLCPVH